MGAVVDAAMALVVVKPHAATVGALTVDALTADAPKAVVAMAGAVKAVVVKVDAGGAGATGRCR